MRQARDQHAPLAPTPPGAAEEFVAAIEAATGGASPAAFGDPMDAARVKEAFDLLLLSERPDRGLEVLVRSRVMEAVLPEAAAMVGFGEGVRHKDVWTHTRKVVRQSPPRPDVRWAALLHDIGKVPTRRFEPDGQVHFIGHAEVGARMFDRIARRLPFPEASRERVRFLIAAHLRASAYEEDWTDAAVRRFAREADEALADLLDLSRADITSRHAEKVRRGLLQIDLLARRVEEVTAADAKLPPLPTGLGTALMAGLGLAAGPGLGRLMRALSAEVDAGRLEARREHAYYVEVAGKSGELLALTDEGSAR
ncbi:MAG: HD domain-containing protein [Deltaproteobacteria bacterium]|nr:HD domain-containing protein [Deltaproteobacteria bacterium]